MSSKGSVLVIDDEYGVRSGIRQILEMEGYDVDDAETGRSALAKLDRHRFDVALIDYQLPDIDGLTLLQAMRARKLDTMTCMITAYANIDTAIAATRQGIDFFLPKPFLPDDLIGVLETLLRHRRLKEDAERLRAEHEASLLALASEKSQTHSLVSCLSDAVLVVNRDGEVVLANPSMASILQTNEASVLRRPFSEVLAAPAFDLLRDKLAAGSSERMVFELELAERSFVVSVVTFLADQGDERGRIVTMSDITVVRRMALERSRFIRTMVHEFKSPLGAIKSMLEVVEDKSLGDSIDPYLSFVGRANHRIDKLVELIVDLLSLSRIDQERQIAPAEPIAVRPAVDEILDVLRPRAESRGIQMTATVPADLPMVPMRADDLRTVLMNLVGNAVKYNRDGGTVAVTASREGTWVTLQVTDTGLGIKQENVPHVFEEFFREKGPATRDIEGNGLGLAIVKRLAERAGGRVGVESVEGKGTTFTVNIPA